MEKPKKLVFDIEEVETIIKRLESNLKSQAEQISLLQAEKQELSGWKGLFASAFNDRLNTTMDTYNLVNGDFNKKIEELKTTKNGYSEAKDEVGRFSSELHNYVTASLSSLPSRPVVFARSQASRAVINQWIHRLSGQSSMLCGIQKRNGINLQQQIAKIEDAWKDDDVHNLAYALKRVDYLINEMIRVCDGIFAANVETMDLKALKQTLRF